MVKIVFQEDIIKLFLDSDLRIWINEALPGLQREACYKADIGSGEDDIYTFTVLVTKSAAFEGGDEFLVDLSWGLRRTVLNFPCGNISLSIRGNRTSLGRGAVFWELVPSETDHIMADEILQKINKIAESVPLVPLQSPRVS